MTFHPSFFVIASLCAFVDAVITVVSAWLLSQVHQAYTSLENVVAFRDDRRVIVRHWLVLFSFFFSLVAYAGIAARVLARAPALALLGFCFHLIFVITELLWRSVDLFALRPVWLAQYAQEVDEVAKTAWRVLVDGFVSSMRALSFVLISGSLLGSLLCGIAVWSEAPLDRWVSVALFVDALRLFLSMAERFGKQKRLAAFNRRIHTPLIVALYALIGVWLWFG